MYESIELIAINAIPSPDIMLVSSFRIKVNQTTEIPFQMVLNVALNRTKAHSETCDFPVYFPAQPNYNSDEHLKMLERFRSGAMLVPVKCQGFSLLRHKTGNSYEYFASADSFSVNDN